MARRDELVQDLHEVDEECRTATEAFLALCNTDEELDEEALDEAYEAMASLQEVSSEVFDLLRATGGPDWYQGVYS